MHLSNFAETCWKHVFSEVNEAAVYINHEAAECLHWYTGDKAYMSFKNAGASSIYELSLFNLKNIKAREEIKKAVIISTSVEPSFYNETLKLILEKNNFSKCILFCAVHTSVLDYNTIFPNKNKTDWNKSQQQDFKWIDDGIYKTQIDETSVTVIYTPIFTASLNEYIFLTPPFGNLMPPIDDKLILQYEKDIQYFVSSMHSLFTNLNAKEDIYFLGKLSAVIAEKLANLPVAVNRRKNIADKRTVSLILLDRTLDLSTACSYNTESVLGRILCTLPHLNHHNNDVAVNMSPLCSRAEECLSSFMVPGCLATNETNFMNLLFLKKQKDLLLSFNKMLTEMITVNESPVKAKLSTRVSAHSLEILIHKFRNLDNIESLTRSSKTLQIIIAVIQALKSDKTAQLELLISFEKLLLQNLAVSRDASSILSQLSSIIQSRSTRGLSMDNLLVLLIHVYSLVGNEINFPPQQEEQLRSALAEAIFQDIEKCNKVESSEDLSVYHQTLIILGFGISDKIMKNTAEQIASHMMDLFHAIANQRQSLQNYKSIIHKSNFQGIATRIGLVERLVNDLINPNKPEIFDLECKTSSLFSASFNLLMKGRMKHPSDSSLIIIYVLGGITADEARIVQEKIALKNSNDCKIILGGSKLLNPLDVLEKVLLSNVSANLS